MADLTPERLAELRRIAEAAKPGPLTMHLCDDARYAAFVDAPHLGPDAPELAVFLTERDARFFAEFDRDTVLAMLDEIERLRKQRDTLISATSNIAGNVLALLDRIEELEAVLRLVYDEFVLDVARWCRHCRLRIDDHEPECPMAEVERVLGLAGGGSQ